MDDGHDGVLAQAKVVRDQPVTEALVDERHHAGGVSIGIWGQPRPAAKDFATSLRGPFPKLGLGVDGSAVIPRHEELRMSWSLRLVGRVEGCDGQCVDVVDVSEIASPTELAIAV